MVDQTPEPLGLRVPRSGGVMSSGRSLAYFTLANRRTPMMHDRSMPSHAMLKTWLINALGFIWVCLGAASEARCEAPALVRVMSFNIRYGTANDGINRWELRKEFLVDTIRDFDPDLLGTQETLASQRDYLADALKSYAVVAAGRDDGKQAGEMAALYYRKDRFEAIDEGHFWLSDTPEKVGSKGWDAALPRIATWVKLKDLRSPEAKPILFVNAHLDHKGQEARVQSAKLIRVKLQELGSEARWIVTGDFNASPSDEPYRALFDPAAERKLLDTFRVMHPVQGPDEGTFSSFQASQTSGPRIDWVGCSEDFEVRLSRIDRTSRQGRTASDHFAILAVLRPTDASAKSDPVLRVLSYNIHHGQGTDGVLSLSRIAKIIRDSDVDIVALQEVDQGCQRSQGTEQTQELARLTGYYAVFGKAIDFDGGQYGQAILSRWPIGELQVHLLPNETAPAPKREQRIALDVSIPTDLGPVRLLGTHLDHSKESLRQEQAQWIDRLLSQAPEISTVLAGDLNATPTSATLQVFAERWQIDPRRATPELATYPSESPKTRIDYVMTNRAGRLVVESLEVLSESVASDHRPIVATLRVAR